MGAQLGQGGQPTQVALSRSEAEMIVRMTAAIADFAEGFSLEFQSYCPPSRWSSVLSTVVNGVGQIEAQLKDKARTFVTAPSELLFNLMDLNECVDGARDARLAGSKLALTISALGAVGEVILGLPWLGVPSYIVSLAIILGRPLAMWTKAEPAAPFKVDVTPPIGAGVASLGAARGRVKFLEYAVASPGERHWWGEVLPGSGAGGGRVCLANGIFRAVVDGVAAAGIVLARGWRFAAPGECGGAEHAIATWSPCGAPMPVLVRGIFAEADGLWVEYAGPNTGGVCRRSGPFCCPFDAEDHAKEDGGITVPGVDGGFVVFDKDGSVLKEAA